MALEKVLTFDWGDMREGFTGAYFTTFVTSPVRTGARSIKCTLYGSNFSYWLLNPFPNPLSEFYYQFAFYMDTLQTAAQQIMRWENAASGAILGGLQLNANNKLELWTGNFATKVGEAANPLAPGQWIVLEVYVKIDPSDGVITLRQDLIEQAIYSGNTQPGADTTVDRIRHGCMRSGYCYLDDVVLHSAAGLVNNSWPNGVKGYLVQPNGDGAQLDWTPTPGPNHYEAVDKTPPSGADNLQSTVVDQVDKLALADLPAEAASIKGVVLQGWAFKASINPPSRLALGLELGATDYYSADLDLPSDQGLVQEIWDEHPAGGPFYVADLNGAQLLLKSRT